MMFHEFLDEDACDVGFPAARLGEDRYMLLDHRIDVEIDRHLMTRQEADVGSVFLVLRQPDHLLDCPSLCPMDRLSCAERGPGNLEKAPVVAVADHADLCGHSLLHVNRITVSEKLSSVQGEIRLPLDLVHMPEHDAARLVLDLDELVPFHGLRDGAAEGSRANIAVDHANEAIAMVSGRPMVGRGFHACIPCAAR